MTTPDRRPLRRPGRARRRQFRFSPDRGDRVRGAAVLVAVAGRSAHAALSHQRSSHPSIIPARSPPGGKIDPDDAGPVAAAARGRGRDRLPAPMSGFGTSHRMNRDQLGEPGARPDRPSFTPVPEAGRSTGVHRAFRPCRSGQLHRRIAPSASPAVLPCLWALLHLGDGADPARACGGPKSDARTHHRSRSPAPPPSRSARC